MIKRLRSSTLSEFVDIKTTAFLFRIFASFFVFYGHGFGKLAKVLSGNFQFLDPIGLGPEISLTLAAFAEGICALLIFIGYYTRLAALFLIVNMSVALLFVHLGQSFGRMELVLMYLLAWITIFLLGPGKFSVDNSRA